MMKPDLQVQIGGLELANPVGLASGTFGYGSEYDELVDIDSVGAMYTKAITLEPRQGNRTPRIVETPSGMLNSIGLANPGLESFLKDKLPGLRARRCAVSCGWPPRRMPNPRRRWSSATGACSTGRAAQRIGR